MQDLVSIIMPCFNSGQYIADAITSVIQQTYEAWELIIIDDHSSDNSLDIIESFLETDQRISLIRSEKNQGGAAARNHGINVAQGKYIAFLDSDDLWENNKLTAHLDFMKKNDAGFTYSDYVQFHQDKSQKEIEIKAPLKVSYNDMLKANFIG